MPPKGYSSHTDYFGCAAEAARAEADRLLAARARQKPLAESSPVDVKQHARRQISALKGGIAACRDWIAAAESELANWTAIANA